MHRLLSKLSSLLIRQAPIWILLISGLWLVVIRPMGPNLALVPGDLGDARFNNYLLEHFYQWVQGADKSYWNAAFFFPFPNTLAFSDNLLGSAPFYALFRAAGLGRETAFQAWIILGFLLNFVAAGYVAQRLKLTPLAAAAAAFFFTFGLPLLAQETHAQLLYRAGIPLACCLLWDFYHAPRLTRLAALVFWWVWQFFAGIYMGIFLSMLLAGMVLLLPFFFSAVENPASRLPSSHTSRQKWLNGLLSWPRASVQAWKKASASERIITSILISGLGVGLAELLWPYYQVTRIYGFYRGWSDVTLMLPKWESYFLADNSQIWKTLSGLIANFTARREHQLFLGGPIMLLLGLGIFGRFRSANRRLAFFHLAAAALLVIATLYIHGFSIFRLVWSLPAMKSLRAVTRIELVLIWPVGVFAGYVIDSLMAKRRLWITAAVYLAVGLMLIESTFYSHITYSKIDAQARLASLRSQLVNTHIPANPILFVARPQWDPWYAPEIDGMLLAQELGWSTLNGYSGNFPPGFLFAESCRQLPNRIIAYMQFAHITDPAYYLALIQRVIPLGFTDCDPSWWQNMPN